MASRDAPAARLRHLLRPVTRTVTLTARAHSTIRSVCRAERRGHETGGILLGHQYPDGGLTVTVAGDPGPQAVQTSRSFRRDAVHAEALANGAWQHDGSVWIGDWHTHPAGPHTPSDVDLTAYLSVLHDPDSGFDVFLSLIVVPDGHSHAIYPWAVTTGTASPTGLWVRHGS